MAQAGPQPIVWGEGAEWLLRRSLPPWRPARSWLNVALIEARVTPGDLTRIGWRGRLLRQRTFTRDAIGVNRGHARSCVGTSVASSAAERGPPIDAAGGGKSPMPVVEPPNPVDAHGTWSEENSHDHLEARLRV